MPSEPTFSGTIAIDLRVEQPTSLVWLNATDLTIDGGELRAGGATQPARVVAGGDDYVGFATAKPIGKGAAQLIVQASTASSTPRRAVGLYRVAEGNGGDDWYAYTFFEPIDARRAFPCFDEPALQGAVEADVPRQEGARRARQRAGGQRETDEPDGMKRSSFAESKPLPSYLVAFVVGPFELVDGGARAASRRRSASSSRTGRAAETRLRASEVTPRIVAALENYFDMAYPYGKLDVAVVPRYWGTMEHPGIVAIGQPLTLIQPDRGDAAAQAALRRTSLVARARALLVRRLRDDAAGGTTCGSTRRSASGPTRTSPTRSSRRGSSRSTRDRRRPRRWTPTGSRRCRRSACPSRRKDAIQNSFDNGITYAKGAAVLHMIEHWVGHDKFMGAIRGYLAAHAWGNADADEFLAALRQSLGAPAAEVMRSFVEQPGVPIVTARAALRRRRRQGDADAEALLQRAPISRRRRCGSCRCA